jgi:hypothetical protein
MYYSNATVNSARCGISLLLACLRVRLLFPCDGTTLQLGVLGWCAEFEELISEVKGLGTSGDMADATRDCALQTCRDILKLQLDVQMQLIILYLVSVSWLGDAGSLDKSNADTDIISE